MKPQQRVTVVPLRLRALQAARENRGQYPGFSRALVEFALSLPAPTSRPKLSTLPKKNENAQ